MRIGRTISRRLPQAAWLAGFCCIFSVGGCTSFQPSNDRPWSPDLAVLARAEMSGDEVTVHNIRNCRYLTPDAYVVDHYDRTVDLARIQTVDFIVVPLSGVQPLAHTMLSFGFEEDEYLVVSVEIRREKGEKYAFLGGLLNQYELAYVVGDERDLIRLRTNYRRDDVYMYRAKATPEQVGRLFVDVMQRVNQLADRPEFYNTLTNNCTTNIVRHINQLAQGRVPYSAGVLMPGYSDRLAYRLKLIDTRLPFEELRRQSNISPAARQCERLDAFSTAIRR